MGTTNGPEGSRGVVVGKARRGTARARGHGRASGASSAGSRSLIAKDDAARALDVARLAHASRGPPWNHSTCTSIPEHRGPSGDPGRRSGADLGSHGDGWATSESRRVDRWVDHRGFAGSREVDGRHESSRRTGASGTTTMRRVGSASTDRPRRVDVLLLRIGARPDPRDARGPRRPASITRIGSPRVFEGGLVERGRRRASVRPSVPSESAPVVPPRWRARRPGVLPPVPRVALPSSVSPALPLLPTPVARDRPGRRWSGST